MANKKVMITLIILTVLLTFFILPFVSSEVIINQQPDAVYNLGDTIPVSVTLKSSSSVSGSFQMDLICGSNSTNFYKNPISLTANEPKNVETSLILEKIIIGNLKGTCNMRAFLNADSAITSGFKVSDWINVQGNLSKTNFNPEESILVNGNAFKENGDPANGFVELSILDGNSTILTRQGTVNNGAFSLNATLTKETRAGNYLLRVTAYESDLSGSISNTGFQDINININQVPTSLEIVFENPEVEPGTSVKVKAILYDQTGNKIDSLVFLTIKNNRSRIQEQIEVSTDEFLEFPIAYNEAPLFWEVVAVSNKLTAKSNFKILEKEAATIEIINKTIVITNTGNVPYNKTVLVKIGDQPINIDVYLDVDESQRWLLTAPDGEYAVEVNVDGEITGASVALTGSTIDVKKASLGIENFVRFPLVWIFILAILGFVAFIFFKRGYQNVFIGYISSALPKASQGEIRELKFQGPRSNRAELALSIKGDKQDVSMITLKAKNIASIKQSRGGEGSPSEILEKVKGIAESQKAATYEDDNGNIFFIFAPARTKTFNNEENALRASQRIKEALDGYNKLAKQKVDFGISLNYGTVIAKQEPEAFKFMGLGNLMTQSKKIASIAENNVLMGERIADKLRSFVKTEKHKKEGMEAYSIKEIKDYEKHEKFLRKFMERNK